MIPAYPELVARIFDTPLMIDASKAAQIAAFLGPRLFGAPVTVEGATAFTPKPAAGRLGDPLEKYVEDGYAFHRLGPVAFIPVEGTLVNKGKWVGAYSGQTSYEGVHRQVNAARADRSVKGVIFEVDSYGGQVDGAFDAAEAIHQLAQEKPTLSILTDHAYSAGYLLASATGGIIAPETGGAGSIGVITMHADYSQAFDQAGITVTILASGKHKAEGNPFEKLPSDVAAKWQRDLDAGRRAFAAAVGRFRGDRLTTEAALATEAESFAGADAVKAGLIDDVGRPSEAAELFIAEISKR